AVPLPPPDKEEIDFFANCTTGQNQTSTHAAKDALAKSQVEVNPSSFQLPTSLSNAGTVQRSSQSKKDFLKSSLELFKFKLAARTSQRRTKAKAAFTKHAEIASETSAQLQNETNLKLREMDDSKAATRPTTPATTPTSMKTAATRPTSATNTNYNFNMATTPTSIVTATASPTTTTDPHPITSITTTPHASCSTISMVLLPSAASPFIINSDTAATMTTTPLFPTQTGGTEASSAQEEEEEVGHDGGEGRGAQVNREERRADLPMEIAEVWGPGIGDGIDLGAGVIELGEDFERGVAAAEEWVGDVLGRGVQGKRFVDEEGLFDVDFNMVVRDEEPEELEDFFAQF
ncbi:hypothetical protein HDU80_011520, partial [Chytriomyces hyalinus]